MTTDGAATVEALRVEFARAKKQARLGNAAAMKAAEGLQAEKAVHGETRNKCWKYALEAIIKVLLLYFLVHDNCLLFML